MNQIRIHLLIKGRVQGVGYRYSAAEAARRLGLRGWVRNTDDGAVEAVAEGPADTVDRFVEWCHQGPPGARVQHIDRRADASTNPLIDFRITR